MATESLTVRSLLLVRNGVDHDARVLRAARVAEQALGGTALVLGVATAAAPAGATTIEGVSVLRLPARTPGLTRLVASLKQISPERSSGMRPAPSTDLLAAAMSSPSNAQDVHAQDERDAATTHGSPPATVSAVLPTTVRLTLSARVRRILSGLSFSRQAISVARQTRPTLVHANDWNTMWTGLAIKVRYGARLVYDSHELWPDRNGRWEWRPWLLAAEALFVHAADEVITSSPGYADALAKRYRISRPHVVRNIPERRASPSSISPERGGLSSPPRVVYVGGLMPGRGLEQMIDALPFLPEVILRAIGPGRAQYCASLLDRATAAGVGDRVEFHAPVAPSEVHGMLAGAAAGLCLIQPICRSYELSLPNKLFEYAAAGIPVLASDVPTIAAMVRSEGLGEVVGPGGSRALVASLERLLSPDDWRLASARTRTFANAHDWPGEASTLAEVYGRARRRVASS